MSLFVDDREGSGYLVAPLAAMGLPVEKVRLDSADLAFIGRGPNDTSVNIGIELKRLDGKSTDLTQSIVSGRLSGDQLPKMLGPTGAYDHAWLLIEGQTSRNAQGLVVAQKKTARGYDWGPIPGNVNASGLTKRVLTLDICGGLHIWHTATRKDTLDFIADLYRWWTDKDQADHQSHLAVHKPSTFLPVNDFRQAVMRWPHIGLKASVAVEREFEGSITKAATAGVDRWAGIEIRDRKGKAKRLGTTFARDIVNFCRGVK